ncbi:MAG: hypothetical protein AABW52_04515 [Nanoarchaeota archaeon]
MENQLVYDVSATERLTGNGKFSVQYNIYLSPDLDSGSISDRYYFSIPDVAKEILKDFTPRVTHNSSLELVISGSEEVDARIHIETNKDGDFKDNFLDRPLTTEELRELYRSIYQMR